MEMDINGEFIAPVQKFSGREKLARPAHIFPGRKERKARRVTYPSLPTKYGPGREHVESGDKEWRRA